MSKEKIYVFHVSNEGGKSERIELTEDQLDRDHKRLLLGQLIHCWNNTPPEQQNEFLSRMSDEASNKMKEDFSKNFTECSRCGIPFPKGTECPICRF